MNDAPEIAVQQSRLAEIDRELGRLRYRHDIAMSAFLFEGAAAVGGTIAALEQERQALSAGLPATEPTGSGPPTGVVPALARPRRARRRR